MFMYYQNIMHIIIKNIIYVIQQKYSTLAALKIALGEIRRPKPDFNQNFKCEI